jgi:hypothetical protein
MVGALASGGAGGQFLANTLAGAEAGNTDWVAHAKSERVELELESGAIVTVNAADTDASLLAAYGLSYDNLDGVMSTRSIFDSSTGVLSGREWSLHDGVLTPPSIPSVTGEIVAWQELPQAAMALAGSASLLANHAFDDLLASYPDERLTDNGTVIHTQTEVPFDATSDQVGLAIANAVVAALLKASAAGPSSAGSSSAASGTSSSHANDLAAEHERKYSEGVAQADAAQQSEYKANQTAKDAARQDRVDQIMSRMGSANASGGGQGPAGSAAPGYGPGDGLASGQPGANVPTASGTGDQGQGIFDRQGFSNDGRVVPNIFKVINQDLWTGWGKSRGAEAALTFPFVLAMSGAVFLPQAINDIPNIPSLLATALTEWDNGNWGKAAEAGGDALGAAGMLGEFVAGADALSIEGGVSNARGPGGPRTTRYDPNNLSPPAWPFKNLRNDPRIVTQSAPSSCNAACAEMVARAAGVDEAVNESSVLTYLREESGNPRIGAAEGGIDRQEIVDAANALEQDAGTAGGQSWKGDDRLLANLLDEVNRVSANGPWSAEMETEATYHSVTVLGIDAAGDVMVLDPAGYAYEMNLDDFDVAWNGRFIFRK